MPNSIDVERAQLRDATRPIARDAMAAVATRVETIAAKVNTGRYRDAVPDAAALEVELARAANLTEAYYRYGGMRGTL